MDSHENFINYKVGKATISFFSVRHVLKLLKFIAIKTLWRMISGLDSITCADVECRFSIFF